MSAIPSLSPNQLETLRELSIIFPGTTRLRSLGEVRQRAEEVLMALSGLFRVHRGKRISRTALYEAMVEIVMDGLWWGERPND